MALSKLEQKARRIKNKELSANLRRLRVGTSWRLNSDFLFQERADWFISVVFATWLSEERTTATLYIKPMALDPLFWEIAGIEENKSMPLSFRRNGAWTCSTPAFGKVELDDELEPHLLAGSLLEWSEQQGSKLENYSINEFVAFIQKAPRGYPGAYLAAEITGLILQGKLKTAQEKCRDARAQKESGGFMWGPPGDRISFVDAAESWSARAQN